MIVAENFKLRNITPRCSQISIINILWPDHMSRRRDFNGTIIDSMMQPMLEKMLGFSSSLLLLSVE